MKKVVEITGGFWLVLLWFAAVNGWELLAVILGAAAIHEAGHCIVLWMCGAKIHGFKLGIFGAELKIDDRHLSYGAEIAAVLAGPAANFLMAAVWDALGEASVEVGANISLCLFNLLPMRFLDGGRALRLLLEWSMGPEIGERVVRWTGAASGFVLAAGLGYVMWYTGGSLWLLPPAWGAMTSARREITRKGCNGISIQQRRVLKKMR